MAILRLFAGLREAAGTPRVEIPGDTVAEVLDDAVGRFGPRFAENLTRARVWVNGEEADGSHPVGTRDEVALIPPVSGGSTLDTPTTLASTVAVPIGVLGVLVVANLSGVESWWAAAVVALSTLWALDVVSTLASRGRDVPVVPSLITIATVVVVSHLLGPLGLGVGLAAAVMATLGWGVGSDTSRMLAILAPAFVVALVAGMATGSLLLARSEPELGVRTLGVFLAAVVVASALSLTALRLVRLPFTDPFTATVVGSVGASLVAAAAWDLDLVAFLIVGLVTGACLVAGRGLGSILRSRQVMLLETPPGFMGLLDGAMLAACLYFPIVTLVS